MLLRQQINLTFFLKNLKNIRPRKECYSSVMSFKRAIGCNEIEGLI